MVGRRGGQAAAAWPEYDPAIAEAPEIIVPVQVNGKLRARLVVAAGIGEEELRAAVLADPKVRAYTVGRTVRKVNVAPGKRGTLVSVIAS